MANAIWATDIAEPEGPAWAPDGSLYVVEMGAERRCVSRISPDGKHRRSILQTVRRPNGLAIDGSERLWIAEAFEGAIICITSDGRELKRITGDRSRFLWPNDLVFGANGLLYMTDSGILEPDFIDGTAIRPDYLDLAYDGRVLEVDPASGRVLRQLDRGLKFPNGIALALDGMLYANETLTGEVYRYDLSHDHPERQRFGNVLRADLPHAFRGPDGMKFGTDGRLYCTVYRQGDVTVLGSDGSVLERIPTLGGMPTNIAFAPAGGFAVITEVAGAAVERMPVSCAGAPLHYPVFPI
jgi:gluconolactonase